MNVERPNSGYLSVEGIEALLGRSMPAGLPLFRFQLINNHRAGRADSRAKVNNTIDLLLRLGVLYEVDEKLHVEPALTQVRGPDIRKVLADRFLQCIAGDGMLERLASVLQFDSATGDVWVDRMVLPGSRDHIPFLMLQFGILHREKLSDRHWRFADDHRTLLLEGVEKFNADKISEVGLSKEELKRRLGEKDQRGEDAEKWVVRFERERLKDHPLAKQVTRISDQNASAGFDILSFSGPRSLRHDRFIEVKSYVGPPGFYWSSNEVRTARELGERYHLYLVDSKKLDDPKYQPRVIPGPYSFFFELEKLGWDKECTEFRFSFEEEDV